MVLVKEIFKRLLVLWGKSALCAIVIGFIAVVLVGPSFAAVPYYLIIVISAYLIVLFFVECVELILDKGKVGRPAIWVTTMASVVTLLGGVVWGTFIFWLTELDLLTDVNPYSGYIGGLVATLALIFYHSYRRRINHTAQGM